MHNFDTDREPIVDGIKPRSCGHTHIGLCKECYDKYYPETDNSKPFSIDVEINTLGMVTKPWGYYIDHYRSERTVLKTIVVNPHSRLSLQSHKNRRERWTILEGDAILEIADTKYNLLSLLRLKTTDSVIIAKNQKHRLINDTNSPLVVAEVQWGACEEDDIERFEDDYGR